MMLAVHGKMVWEALSEVQPSRSVPPQRGPPGVEQCVCREALLSDRLTEPASNRSINQAIIHSAVQTGWQALQRQRPRRDPRRAARAATLTGARPCGEGSWALRAGLGRLRARGLLSQYRRISSNLSLRLHPPTPPPPLPIARRTPIAAARSSPAFARKALLAGQLRSFPPLHPLSYHRLRTSSSHPLAPHPDCTTSPCT